MEKTINKIIILGAGASGKDFAKIILTNFGFSSDTSYTTRSPRIGETNGKDYYFISEREMISMIIEKKFLQFNQLPNGACYGTSISEWKNNNVFIMTPNVIQAVKEYYKNNGFEEDFLIIKIDIPESIRISRMEKRGFTFDDIMSRINMDKELFENENVSDITITNPEFTDVSLLSMIFDSLIYNTQDLKNKTLKRL